MKTKILFVVLMLVAAAVSIRMNLKCERLDSLMLENVEALATGEITIGCCLAIWGDCQNDVKAPYVTCTIN